MLQISYYRIIYPDKIEQRLFYEYDSLLKIVFSSIIHLLRIN